MRLFKYATASTAKIILDNCTLRWSSPVMFNDPFDVQFDLHLDYDEASLVELVCDELWKIYSGEKPFDPANELGHALAGFLHRFPGLSKEDLLDRQGLRRDLIAGMQNARAFLPAVQAHQRTLLADAKVLCLSQVHDNILMWSHYSLNHSGAVLEFTLPEHMETALHRAKPVVYSSTMPRLMTQDDMVRFFSGQWRMDADAIMHRSIFVKAADWSYERESRIWLPGTNPAAPFIDIRFDPALLTAIYFGCRCTVADRNSLLNSLRRSFPTAAAHRGVRSTHEFALRFDPVL